MADLNDSANNDKKLDEMLDRMLSTYSSAEPRPGLETRILANLKEQSGQRSSTWRFGWMWVGAVATVGLVTILFVSYLSRPKMQPVALPVASQPGKQQTPQPKAAERPAPPPVMALKHTQQHRTKITEPAHTAEEIADVRQEVFPSRSPLSEHDKLLFRYLAGTPKEELIAQSHSDPAEENADEGSNNDRPNNLTQVHQPNSNTR